MCGGMSHFLMNPVFTTMKCNEIDTIEYLFPQCSYNRVFWQGVSKLVQRALDINIKLYDSDIIFGLPGVEDIFRIINFKLTGFQISI